MYRIILATSLGLLLTACGSEGASPENENTYVVSEYNVDLYNLFTCKTSISSTKNADVYAELGYSDTSLETVIRVVYSVFYGSNPRQTERIVRAEVRSTESGVLSFNQNATKYIKDTEQSSAVGVTADVSEGNNSDGQWLFKVTDNVAGFTYTDTDTNAIEYTFSSAEGNVECAGSVKNDPTVAG